MASQMKLVFYLCLIVRGIHKAQSKGFFYLVRNKTII